MRTNEKMRNILDKINLDFARNLYLDKIADNGFLFVEDCIFLKSFFPKNLTNFNNLKGNFFDKVELEWFYNSLQIHDHCKDFYLENSIYFLKKCMMNINKIDCNINLTAICSINFNENISVKAGFYRNRMNEQRWLDDNIEMYEEAVIEFESHTMLVNDNNKEISIIKRL